PMPVLSAWGPVPMAAWPSPRGWTPANWWCWKGWIVCATVAKWSSASGAATDMAVDNGRAEGQHSLSRPFILRPVATSLLMLAFLITGLIAWRMLPVAALPQVVYPIIQVFTFQPGAGPEVTARTITAPLERYLGQIPGLKQMSSTSSGGAAVITLQVDLGDDLRVAEQEVQAAMNTADSLLPNDLPTPPIYRKVNPADAPILTLAITSDSLPLPEVHDLVDTRMAQKLAQISGVGLVSLAGGQRPAVRVRVNPEALAAYGLNLSDVRALITSSNVNQPKGNFDEIGRAHV